jgi:hypothetical protein
MQLLFAVCEPAKPDLGALKIGQYTDWATGACCGVPHAAQVSLMIGIVTMTHVESGDIHSSGNQLRQALRT